MYHSITFGDKNTYDDWHLVPSSRPLFSMPSMKGKFIELPGSDGSIDLSEAITGYPVYANRTGSIEFIVLNDYGEWYNRYSEIASYIHGKKMRAILEDEPGWYYEGRFSLNEWRSEKDWSRIVIEYSVDPYKWSITTTSEPWLWNPFSFVNGVIESGVYIDSSSVPPTIWSGAGLYTTFNVSTTPINLEYTEDETGRAPAQPVFLVFNNNIILTISKDNTAVAEKTISVGNTGTIPGLVLWCGKWLYNSKEVSVSIKTESGTADVTLSFRVGRL